MPQVFYDEVVWNADFISSFPNYDLTNLHMMEICFLEMIDYNVIVHQGLYAKYYFELRSISEEQNFGNLRKKHPLQSLEGWETARKKASTETGTLTTTSAVQIPFIPEKPKKLEIRRGSMPPPAPSHGLLE